ncbi:hypothetical protein INR49_014472 [Caranx melampygus]|nr:hypothetical protein INR49_014472 [Caranx melampygus]
MEIAVSRESEVHLDLKEHQKQMRLFGLNDIGLALGDEMTAAAAEDLDEGPSELDVEGGVDNRVEGTVDIPQPGESTVKCRRHVACPAVGVQNVSHKERQPADEKHPWSSQRAERFGEKTAGNRECKWKTVLHLTAHPDRRSFPRVVLLLHFPILPSLLVQIQLCATTGSMADAAVVLCCSASGFAQLTSRQVTRGNEPRLRITIFGSQTPDPRPPGCDHTVQRGTQPNSRGQDTAKAKTHTVAIIAKTLFLERWVVLYKTGITTAVYLQTHAKIRGHRVMALTVPVLEVQIDSPGHNQRSHEQVGHSQADHQVVGCGLKGTFPQHSQTHQYVSKHNGQDEQGIQHGIVVMLPLVLP